MGVAFAFHFTDGIVGHQTDDGPQIRQVAVPDKSRMMGIIMATIGVLFKKALPSATGGSILSWQPSKVLGNPINFSDTIPIAPVVYLPAATMNKAPAPECNKWKFLLLPFPDMDSPVNTYVVAGQTQDALFGFEGNLP